MTKAGFFVSKWLARVGRLTTVGIFLTLVGCNNASLNVSGLLTTLRTSSFGSVFYLGAIEQGGGGFQSVVVPVAGSSDGTFSTPTGVAIDNAGNIYVVDSGNYRVSKFSATGAYIGSIGNVTQSQGSCATGITNGWCTVGNLQMSYFTSSSLLGGFNSPGGIAVDSSGNLYVADTGNNRIQMFNSAGVAQGAIGYSSSASGTCTAGLSTGWCTGSTFAATTGNGGFSGPIGVALDSSGNLYVADTGNHRIEKFSTTGAFQGSLGWVSTAGGAGCTTPGIPTTGWCTSTAAGFSSNSNIGGLHSPHGITLDTSGNIYVADYGNNRVQAYTSSGAVTGASGLVSTTGTGCTAGNNPSTWCVSGSTTQFSAGTGNGAFSNPTWVYFNSATSHIYVSDNGNNRIQSLNPLGAYFQQFGGGGNGAGQFNGPMQSTTDASGNYYIVDQNNSRLEKFNSSFAFQGSLGGYDVALSNWYSGNSGFQSGSVDGEFTQPYFTALDNSGNLYVSDDPSRVIKISATTGSWVGAIGYLPGTTSTGTCSSSTTITNGWCTGGTFGPSSAEGGFYHPRGMVLDPSSTLYVADSGNNRIMKFNASGVYQGMIGFLTSSPSGSCTAAANNSTNSNGTPGWCNGSGNSSIGTSSVNGAFHSPLGVAIDASGFLYVADNGNSRIVKIASSTGVVVGAIGYASSASGSCIAGVNSGWCTGSTFATSSVDGGFNQPTGVSLDGNGNLYVTDSLNRVQRFIASTGVFTGAIGFISSSSGSCPAINGFTGSWCSGGNFITSPNDGAFSTPFGITQDGLGNLFVADRGNDRICKFNIGSGAFIGCIGMTSTSTGNCVAGQANTQWCTGGTFVLGNAYGALSSPQGMISDLNGTLYISDSSNSRIVRFYSP